MCVKPVQRNAVSQPLQPIPHVHIVRGASKDRSGNPGLGGECVTEILRAANQLRPTETERDFVCALCVSSGGSTTVTRVTPARMT